MNKKSLIKNKRVFKQPKRILSGLKLTDASGIAKEAFNSSNIVGTIGSMASGLGTVVESSLANAKVDTSKADNAIAAINAYEPNTSSLDAIASGYNAVNTNVGINAEDMTVSTGEGLANMGKAGLAGFTTGLQTGGIWGGIAGFLGGTAAAGGAWAKGASDAKDAEDLKRRELNIAQMSASKKAESARDTYHKNEYDNFMINHAAYGGPLYNHSGDWSNGLTFINEGGTHEENPFDGVLMGFDQENIPNLVEEGEIIYNDYVFSNRLKPSKEQLESYGLNKKYNDWTFAKIVEDLQKSSAETPLDKISKESLDDMMAIVINMQEEVRMKKGLTGENRLMKFGGNKRILSGEKKTRAELGKETTAAMPKLSSGALSLQSSPSNIGGASPLGNDALRTKSINTFNKKIKADIQNSLNNINKSDFDWSMLGMYAPIVDSLGKTIYNIAKPVDESNIIAEEAYSTLPRMELPRLTQHKVAYKPIDRNALINPVINTGRATARDIQNIGTTGADVMNRLALNAYNTQKAIGQAYLEADAKDLANRMQNAQFNLGVDSADAQLLQAVQAANMQIAEKIAAARIADATQLEQLEQLKGQAIDTTSTAAIQGLADLTRQNIEWNWLKNSPQYAEAVAAIYGKKADGGMLTRKKRRK